MKVVSVYMLSVHDGKCNPLWATVILGDLQLHYVRSILEKASTRDEFNLNSTVHHAIIQETKENVQYILDACGLPAPGKTYECKVAGTCIGQVKINKVEGWLCGQ